MSAATAAAPHWLCSPIGQFVTRTAPAAAVVPVVSALSAPRPAGRRWRCGSRWAGRDPDLPVTALMPMTSLALAYGVASRTREFGLRLALGADATQVRRMVLAPAARVILTGIAFGALAG